MNIYSILAQVQPGSMPDLSGTTEGAAAAMPVAPESLSLFDLAMKGGPIMIVLLLLSILAIYLFIERYLVIRKAARTNHTFMNQIRDYMKEGKISSALSLCEAEGTPGARMIQKGIQRLGRPMQDLSVAVENVGNIEIAKLEKGLPLLATVAAGAPMIGFLGTVTGMIHAFFDMASAGNNVNISLLSSGIYEALVTTVGGLIVGIICLFAYNHLVYRIDHVVTKSETQALEFMDMLNEPIK